MVEKNAKALEIACSQLIHHKACPKCPWQKDLFEVNNLRYHNFENQWYILLRLKHVNLAGDKV